MMAAAAALFAACSSNDLAEEKSPQTTQPTDEQVVGFDAYVNRGTTRGGFEGSLTAGTITDATAGFGVFGYYTNNILYGQTAIPDFFYNQKVTHSGGSWTYSPFKYWPNEFGTGAESAGQDKLTFFAYAPYVEVNPGTGRMANKADEQYGIVGMTSNSTSGDPYVKYIASFDPEKRVDLCYGVANSDFKSSVDGNNNNVLRGKPYIDVIKPKINDKIHFNFKHALASLNVTIDADIDQVSHGNATYLDDNTKIYVRKVTFEGFADKGSLNLNSEAITDEYTPNWFELNSINRRLSSGTVTIYDGRRDGREGQANATASNETPNNLNSSIIEDDGATTAGVPVTPVNLFDSDDAEAPIFVIPTDEDLKVTIVYDVETADINLSTYLSDGKTKGSSVENTITKTITVSDSELKLKAGKAYKVSLHLGMTSVKFDATVTEWPASPTAADNTDLPINSPASFNPTAPAAQAATGGSVDVTVKDASDGNVDMSSGYTFVATYSDNNGNTNVDVTSTLSPIGNDGKFTVTLPALTDFYGRVYKVVITKDDSGEKQTVNITQNAPTVTDITATYSDPTITLTNPSVTPSSIIWGWSNITVVNSSSNPVPVTNNEDGTLTFASLPNDTYTITITNGDVVKVATLNIP